MLLLGSRTAVADRRGLLNLSSSSDRLQCIQLTASQNYSLTDWNVQLAVRHRPVSCAGSRQHLRSPLPPVCNHSSYNCILSSPHHARPVSISNDSLTIHRVYSGKRPFCCVSWEEESKTIHTFNFHSIATVTASDYMGVLCKLLEKFVFVLLTCVSRVCVCALFYSNILLPFIGEIKMCM